MHDAVVAARGFAESAGINPDQASQLAIVVEELLTNLYDHGGVTLEDAFVLELILIDTELGLTLTDSGKPFDPRFAELEGPVPARGGGAGLKLVRAWASSIDYQIGDGFNRLVLRFPRR